MIESKGGVQKEGKEAEDEGEGESEIEFECMNCSS